VSGSDSCVPMPSVLADRRPTGHNRHGEAEKVKVNKNSCREAAWFNPRLQLAMVDSEG
jgi:hypothetical protein